MAHSCSGSGGILSRLIISDDLGEVRSFQFDLNYEAD